MSDYRYILFPPARQPTVEEAAELESFVERLGRRYAFGTHRKDGALAILFEAVRFDALLADEPRFGALIEKWIARGGELVDRLPFVKDPTAFRPRPARLSDLAPAHVPADSVAHDKRLLAAKELSAKESAGLSRLAVDRAIERYAAWHRFAATGPYILLGIAALATIVGGVHIGRRLTAPDVEQRRETILRVAGDGMEESLARRAKQQAWGGAEAEVAAVVEEP